MNIEEKIRNKREAFDDMKMPEGSRERFEARLRSSLQAKSGKQRITTPTDSNNSDLSSTSRSNMRRMHFLTWTTVAAAAAIAVFVMITGMRFEVVESVPKPQTADNKLVEMRQFYDDKVEEAITNLEEVMTNVDDSTKMQINAVIHDLINMGDEFADMAPLPEERQMAITEQIYDNKLRTIDLITKQINK